MLILGDLDRWRARGHTPPKITGFHFAGIAELNAALLARLRPDVILSGLVQETFDVLDVAANLRALNFPGRYRAVSDALPNPGLIVLEVRKIAPKLDFAILSLDLG